MTYRGHTVLVLLVILYTAQEAKGSCSSPTTLCCPGHNNSCRRNGCYCDEYCLTVIDCCSDYNSTCTSSQPTTRLILKMKGKMPANAGEEKIQEALQKLTLALEAKVQAVCSHCTIQILRHKKTSQP
ncbi:uncharacterized protein LOC134466255 isoform X1 [Engraulis encrasicolus]|uniref:uncharacterized protein LOC134466255 isoform X1 n=1 Tax=Engraulis encrasicolus TaxID=184585 RepID=UPI002FD57EBB